jgi:hypothetical protein
MPQNEIDILTDHLNRLEHKIDELVSKEVLDLIIKGYESRITMLETWRRGFWLTLLTTVGGTVILIVNLLNLWGRLK